MQDTVFAARRQRFLDAIGERGCAVIPSAPVAIRNNDVEHEYRQDSDFQYLTGLDEPESVLVLTNVHDEHCAVLFVRPRDPERETWDGPRVGIEGAVARHGADVAFPIAELDQRLVDYVSGAEDLHYRLGIDPEMDAQILHTMDGARRRHRMRKAYPTALVDPGRHLHEARLRKEPDELEAMRAAAAVTDRAHRAAMAAARPGAFEYELEAEILRVFRGAGCERPAYGPIVGSGPNATILHHRRNDRLMNDGDLVLIDAGCELDYYACDVTRTFPANGTFSEPQRQIYGLVLRAQEACIAATKPGATMEAVHDIAVRVLTEGLIELGLIEGPIDEAIASGRFKPYYMHRTSHWLGMDVHDVGRYFVEGEPRPFEPGFVLTIEPGLYVPVDDESVDAKWRGIGVRIEDDILVTETGYENLTAAIPKTIDEVEAATR